MKLPKGILFDLDDTIISFDASADCLWQEVCEKFAAETEGIEADTLQAAIDRTRKWYWQDAERHGHGRHNLAETRRDIVRMAFSDIGVSDVGLANQLADAYTNGRHERLELFPDAERTLEGLSRNGTRLALITNGHAEGQREKIERFKLERFFECVLIEGEVGIAKPDPEIFLMALDQLRLSPEKTWMVGDNLEWDIGGAQAVGIFAVWNDWRGNGLPTDSTVKPDRMINGIEELVG